MKLVFRDSRLLLLDHGQPFIESNPFRGAPRRAGMGMGVCVDEAREQRAPLRINDFVGVGPMLAGGDGCDEPVPDLHLAEERLRGGRFRQDECVPDNNRSRHQMITFASPRVAHRSSRPKTENEITPRTARIVIATNSRSVRSSVAEVMMR